MAKKNKEVSLVASAASIDPTLAALFTSSAGPVEAPSKSRYSAPQETKSKGKDEEDVSEEDEVLSEASQELDYDDEEDEDEEGETSKASDEEEKEGEDGEEKAEPATSDDVEMETAFSAQEQAKPKRERKRKRKDDNDDLEGRYFNKIAEQEEASEPTGKRQKGEAEDDEDGEDDGDDDVIPQHESLAKETKSSDLERADRTIFLANVSIDVVASKAAKKTLMSHLGSILENGDKVESIRFRSVAFSTGAMPKRAAYITKQVMEATTKSTNAYAVYSSTAAARKAVNTLNGSEVLGRHIRVDSVAHPGATDHRRCVFVGNLGFVDDESLLTENDEGETVQKKRNKVPSDIEEGLWRTFSTQGKVENVRVVRDQKTRVGKGFAYVQFYDANAVESALLLDGKRFPPMLPRTLRVTRAKDPRKTQKRLAEAGKGANGDVKSTKYKKKLTPEELSMTGRAGKLLGRAGAAAERRRIRSADASTSRRESNGATNDFKTPEEIIFEGARASANKGVPRGLRLGKNPRNRKAPKSAKSGKPTGRGARRATEWRKKQETAKE